MVRWLVLVIATTLTLGCSSSSPPPPAAATRSPSAASAAHPEGEPLPLVVVVRADWCPTCRKIEPAVTALMREYDGRARFLVLDVTDDAKSAQSKAAAEHAGVGKFFADNESTGVVAIFSAKGRAIATLAGETDLARYRGPLSAAGVEPR